MMVKFTYGGAIDKQGRINLGRFAEKDYAVLYMTDADDLVHVEFFGSREETEDRVMRVDSKNRICLPIWLRKGYTDVLIGRSDTGKVLIKLK